MEKLLSKIHTSTERIEQKVDGLATEFAALSTRLVTIERYCRPTYTISSLPWEALSLMRKEFDCRPSEVFLRTSVKGWKCEGWLPYEGFKWDPNKTEAKQKCEYMAHLKKYFPLTERKRKAGDEQRQSTWVAATDHLQWPSVPFPWGEVRGTCDAAVCLESAVRSDEALSAEAAEFIMEIKTIDNWTGSDIQTEGELLATMMKSSRRQVIAMRYDLNGNWRIMWLHGGTIKRCTLWWKTAWRLLHFLLNQKGSIESLEWDIIP